MKISQLSDCGEPRPLVTYVCTWLSLGMLPNSMVAEKFNANLRLFGGHNKKNHSNKCFGPFELDFYCQFFAAAAPLRQVLVLLIFTVESLYSHSNCTYMIIKKTCP
jgi:hypothetical protein